MSLTSGPIKEAEQASEQLADHVADRIERAAPSTVSGVIAAALPALAEYDLVIRIRLEKR